MCEQKSGDIVRRKESEYCNCDYCKCKNDLSDSESHMVGMEGTMVLVDLEYMVVD